MSNKLWVAFNTCGKTFIDKVSIQGCEDIADFLKEIKKEFALSVPSSCLTLFTSDGTTKIDVGDSPADYFEGNSSNNPLVVMTAVVGKSSRQASTRKMAVEASCRKYLDAMARQISQFYDFEYNPIYGATMGNVLKAKNGKEGKDWKFRLAIKKITEFDYRGFQRVIKKGHKLATCALPNLFQPDEWEKISNFNSITSERIHNTELPRLPNGKAYIVIPTNMYSAQSVAFLKDIGVRSFLLSDRDAIEVKNEDSLSESSYID